MGQGLPLIRQNLRFCHLPPREGYVTLCTREAFITAGVIRITVGADIIRSFFNGTGFVPHPSAFG